MKVWRLSIVSFHLFQALQIPLTFRPTVRSVKGQKDENET